MEKRGVRNEKILFLRCRSPNCLKLLLFNLPFVQKDDDGKILGSDTTGNEKHEFGTPSYAIHVRRNFYYLFFLKNINVISTGRGDTSFRSFIIWQ